LVAHFPVGPIPSVLLHFAADLLAQLLEGGGIANVCRKLVVKLRNLKNLDPVHLDLELYVFALEIIAWIILGERDGDLLLLAYFRPDELLFKPVDKSARSNLERVTFGRSTL